MKEIDDDIVRGTAVKLMDILKMYHKEDQKEFLDFFEKSILKENGVCVPDYLDLSANIKAFFASDTFAGLNREHAYCNRMEEDGKPFCFLLLQKIQGLLEIRLSQLLGGTALTQKKIRRLKKEVFYLLEYYSIFLLEHQKYDTINLRELEQKKKENERRYNELYSCYRENDLSEELEKMEMLCGMGTLMWEYYEVCAQKYVVLCRRAFATYHFIYLSAVLGLLGVGVSEEEDFPYISQLFSAVRSCDNLRMSLRQAVSSLSDRGTPENQCDMADAETKPENQRDAADAENMPGPGTDYLKMLLKDVPRKRTAADEEHFQKIQLRLAAPILLELLRKSE